MQDTTSVVAFRVAGSRQSRRFDKLQRGSAKATLAELKLGPRWVPMN